jgi:AraC-like DNA-binding protein
VVDIYPAGYGENAVRVEFFGDEIDRVTEFRAVTGETIRELRYFGVFPATHYAVSADKREAALAEIGAEMLERVAYFESERPYLNGDLTINDLVKVLYSNKLYISKAISHFTGRNFCQFVNYYRVIYSVERFRDNPELKVLELSNLCGFNSMVSYTMAFRLFMGETPSEWCRKEKSRIVKERK